MISDVNFLVVMLFPQVWQLFLHRLKAAILIVWILKEPGLSNLTVVNFVFHLSKFYFVPSDYILPYLPQVLMREIFYEGRVFKFNRFSRILVCKFVQKILIYIACLLFLIFLLPPISVSIELIIYFLFSPQPLIFCLSLLLLILLSFVNLILKPWHVRWHKWLFLRQNSSCLW